MPMAVTAMADARHRRGSAHGAGSPDLLPPLRTPESRAYSGIPEEPATNIRVLPKHSHLNGGYAA